MKTFGCNTKRRHEGSGDGETDVSTGTRFQTGDNTTRPLAMDFDKEGGTMNGEGHGRRGQYVRRHRPASASILRRPVK